MQEVSVHLINLVLGFHFFKETNVNFLQWFGHKKSLLFKSVV